MSETLHNVETHAVTPIFLLSLPRSGSTMLQRLMGAHESIATTSEPWLLLAPFFARREHGALSIYGHRTAARALRDLFETSAGGEALFRAAVREYAMCVYEGLSAGRPFFLDKTPRYHFIADDIVDTFAHAKYIILWRNPLAIAASLIDSFGGGRWILHRFHDDLYCGIERLLAVQQRLGNNVHSVQYETLTTEPRASLDSLSHYLGLSGSRLGAQGNLELRTLHGRMGDQTGTIRYNHVSGLSVNRWTATMKNPLRKSWCREYLRWLGPLRCASMGYDFDELARTVEDLPVDTSDIRSDVVHRVYGRGYRLVMKRFFEHKDTSYRQRSLNFRKNSTRS